MLADFFRALAELVEWLILNVGVVGITLVAMLENLFPPTPSELLYPLSGKLAYDGVVSPIAVIIAGITGSLLGSLIYYRLGYALGDERVRLVITRWGTWHIWRFKLQLITVEHYERALELFERRGAIIVLVARLMPVVHSVISIPAGVVRMPLLPFVIYTCLGAGIHVMMWTLFGYWLGDNWEQLLEWMDVYEVIWYGVITLALTLYGLRWLHRRRKRFNLAQLEDHQFSPE